MKYREFWVTDSGGPQFDISKTDYPLSSDSVLMIERTAYADLLAQAEKLAEALENIAQEPWSIDLKIRSSAMAKTALDSWREFRGEKGGMR